jgi:hypothetical protein
MMHNKSIHTSVALKALAFAGLLVFAAQPAMALDTPDTPATASAPASPSIDHAVPETSAAEVEVADDIAGSQHVETPEIEGVSSPDINTPNVGTPELETPESN